MTYAEPILEVLSSAKCDEERTARYISGVLGVNKSKMYSPLRTMCKQGLIIREVRDAPSAPGHTCYVYYIADNEEMDQ